MPALCREPFISFVFKGSNWVTNSVIVGLLQYYCEDCGVVTFVNLCSFQPTSVMVCVPGFLQTPHGTMV